MIPADGPSRHPDYEAGCEGPSEQLVATMPVTTVEPLSDLLLAMKAAQNTDPLATEIKNIIG